MAGGAQQINSATAFHQNQNLLQQPRLANVSCSQGRSTEAALPTMKMSRTMRPAQAREQKTIAPTREGQ
eukprot:CAMPEP_0174283388 /NCGR_PEP_ID=MMETSP0809-20121228/4080_1 /TAXON_ID=73025 ORGANISM="Eutreptiella gymnastica-like, Strain CCMP1594" /NCGR_SAMPLE_ID=MMETSP0809 /ASSEMBLY_ACC=CAM_ASM_000658 /LENGTH=68 /DNA_ID=CAMNT_0015378295 /DNA_START=387 /DNA_END=593 /DNA_ORIENTATION=+